MSTERAMKTEKMGTTLTDVGLLLDEIGVLASETLVFGKDVRQKLTGPDVEAESEGEDRPIPSSVPDLFTMKINTIGRSIANLKEELIRINRII